VREGRRCAISRPAPVTRVRLSAGLRPPNLVRRWRNTRAETERRVFGGNDGRQAKVHHRERGASGRPIRRLRSSRGPWSRVVETDTCRRPLSARKQASRPSRRRQRALGNRIIRDQEDERSSYIAIPAPICSLRATGSIASGAGAGDDRRRQDDHLPPSATADAERIGRRLPGIAGRHPNYSRTPA